MTVAGFAQRVCQRFVDGSKSVIGGDHENRTSRHGRRQVVEVQLLLVVIDLASQRLATGPGKRQQIVVTLELLGLIRDGGWLGLSMTSGLIIRPNVPCRDKHCAGDLWIVRGC